MRSSVSPTRKFHIWNSFRVAIGFCSALPLCAPLGCYGSSLTQLLKPHAADMADNADQINTNAQKPKRASIDGQSAEQHSIDDQIKADRYAAEQSAGSNSKPGIRLFQLRNKGTV